MPLNREEPPDNENAFFVNITAAYQFLKDWRLKRSLEKIKKYEDKLNAVNCNKCANGSDWDCKFRKVNQINNDYLPAGIPCKFWRSKKGDSNGEPCDYRGG